jgi:ElaB/YqjD/DUF883 family membrane-anchored ribosome-binding protein
MVQRFAENYESTNQSSSESAREYADRAKDVAQDAGQQAKSVIDSVINYARANPTEAIVVAAGAALALGLLVGYPRLQTKQERMAREFERRVRKAYADVQREAPDSHSWDRLTEWAKSNLPASLR